MEEADELKANIEKLEGEVVELRAELAAKEDANNQLSKDLGLTLNNSLQCNTNFTTLISNLVPKPRRPGSMRLPISGLIRVFCMKIYNTYS